MLEQIQFGSPTTDMFSVKPLLDSVLVSIPGAKFFTVDTKNVYLIMPLKRPEYLRLKLSDMPDSSIEH